MNNSTYKMLRAFICSIILTTLAATLHAQCDASFTYTQNGNNVTFSSNNVSEGKLSYWYFGDGTWDIGFVSTHGYLAQGSYSVKHVVEDSTGACADSIAQTIQVNYTPTCQSSFYFNDSLPLSYNQFTANPIVVGTFVTSYTWTVDGVVAGANQWFIDTLTPGSHDVCLSINTQSGCTSQSCQTVNVFSNCNISPSFTYTTSDEHSGLLSFSPSPVQPNLSYEWLIMGSYIKQQSPTVQFWGPGSYPVSLFITDSSKGCGDSTTQWVTIHYPCDTFQVAISYHSTPGDSKNIAFSAKSNMINQPITAETWFVDSTVVDSTMSFSYQFADTGYYQVCVAASSGMCSQQTCTSVVITDTGSSKNNVVASYPNPAVNSVNLNITLATNATISATVYDINGNRMFAVQQQGVKGNNTIQIPVQRLNRGQYFIDIMAGGERKKSVFDKF